MEKLRHSQCQQYVTRSHWLYTGCYCVRSGGLIENHVPFAILHIEEAVPALEARSIRAQCIESPTNGFEKEKFILYF